MRYLRFWEDPGKLIPLRVRGCGGVLFVRISRLRADRPTTIWASIGAY